MVMSVDPGAARAQAQSLAQSQGEWEQLLAGRPPQVPVGAFGVGLASQGQRFQTLLEQTHRVRMAHARRLHDAGVAAHNLVDAVESADSSNATALHGGK